MKPFSRIVSLLFTAMILILSLSCCRKNAPRHADNLTGKAAPTRIRLITPQPNQVITSGDSVKIEIVQADSTATIDSLAVSGGKGPAIIHPGLPARLYWHSANSRVGKITLKILVYFSDSLQESHNINLVVLSNLEPQQYTYRVIRKLPHDDLAYTQGLVYSNGKLYESTGLEGKSSVRIVDMETGKPEKITHMAPQYFGEGIALFKDQIYQITYRSQVGFVYDKNTLKQIRSFDYQFLEGWGLTANNNFLIMTDGSAQLFYLEPEFFTQVDRVEVFDNKGRIDSLNEIEYINGKVLANVYGESFIVVIEPESGKVTGKIELETLMPSGSKGDYNKVLNGIAYNPANGHLYVTGKNWPVLYELELKPAL
ncbi:MAG: glutaminyl-peptide cyclotransferase [Bacteroidales bacterium]|nr:glutaminyl-peptide cyclotransferase [Bacteroidales bacterium]